MTLGDILKNIFYVLLIFTFAQPFISTIKKTYIQTVEPHTKVGYVEISGTIEDSTKHINNLKMLFKDKEIKAVLIKIESLGGVAGSSEALFHELVNLKKEYPKQVAVLVENVCASGAYWVACAADHIVASPVSWVGSIGAYIQSFKLKEFINYHNIKYDAPKAGSYKNVTDPFVDATPEQMTMLQTLVNQTYQEFAQSVATARSKKLSMKNVNEWANGKIFTGRQALELGLIDELGSRSTAEVWIKEKAMVEGKIEWVQPSKPSALQNLLGAETHENGPTAHVATTIANTICSSLEERYSLSMRT
jgi:protease-4